MTQRACAVLLGLVILGSSCVAWSEEYRDGLVAFSHGKEKKAMQIWTELGEKGDSVSQSILARLYAEGHNNVKVDYKKAFYWASKCSDYLVRCQLNLGKLYDEGHGVKKDPEAAADMYRRVVASSADWPEGISEARVKLGLLYWTGALGNANRKEGEQHFRLAANAGVADGQYWLGSVYEKNGTPADLIEAAKWYRLAMENDDKVAAILGKMSLKKVEEKLTTTEIDKARRLAKAWRPQ